MRFRHRDGSTVHLAYCTNVHPAEDATGVNRQLDTVAAEVRRLLDVPRLGVGLWLAAGVAAELRSSPARFEELRRTLERNGLEVVTLNGFPYGGFHDPVVKHAVYRPDWTTQDRYRYTEDLAHLLAGLLPDDIDTGAISTLPLGWAGWLDGAAVDAATANLERLAGSLVRLAASTGKSIVVGLEPEPGCVLDTAAAVARYVAPLGPHLGVALDTCHLAVEFEDPVEVAARLRTGGANVAKVQVASALRLADDRAERLATLRRYDEPRFLHQTRVQAGGGVAGVDDVGLVDDRFPTGEEWRVHFHQPVHVGGPDTTQNVAAAALSALLGDTTPQTRLLEVETYTWTVLPPEDRPGSPGELAAALAAELDWTRDRLTDLGLVEVAA